MTMTLQPPTRSSKPPLGGIRGDWRCRLLRFHVPIALASALVLALFLTLPSFDANAYAHVDIFSGAFPQERQRGEGGPMDHEGDQDSQMELEQGGDQNGTMDESGDQPAGDHGGDRSARSTPAATPDPSGQPAGDHGGDQPARDHGGDETEGMGGDS